MASDLLTSLIAANDPQAAQMLSGYTGSQLQNAAIDPNFGHNEGIFGALAKTLAGFRGSGMLSDAVQQVAAARAANRPELAQVLAGSDPYKAIADNPSGYSQQTLATLLSGVTPESVAQARKAAADAELAGMTVSGYRRLQPGAGTAADPTAGVSPISSPVSRRIAPPASASSGGASAAPASADTSVLGTLRPQAAAEPDITPSALAAMPRQQQAQLLAQMGRAKKQALMDKITQQRAQMMQQGGGR
jgi:hypothetical protein